MKKIFKKIIPPYFVRMIVEIKNRFFVEYAIKSFSQEGEDIILSRYFEKKRGSKGSYVDIGAHHPFRFSNTYHFYKKGWRGINLDATPGSMRLFHKFRPNDINLECAISDSTGTLPYCIFKEPALNTFSRELAQNYIECGQILLKKELIKVYPLARILDKYLSGEKEIDFMSIDAEGFDFQVLQSNDWKKYKPEVVLIESLDFDLANSADSKIYEYLRGKGYMLFAKTINTLFFERTD